MQRLPMRTATGRAVQTATGGDREPILYGPSGRRLRKVVYQGVLKPPMCPERKDNGPCEYNEQPGFGNLSICDHCGRIDPAEEALR